MFGRVPTVEIRLDEAKLSEEWGLTQSGSISNSVATIMQVHAYCPAMSLAATGGIGSASDLIKVLLAGADVGMIASAIYRDGPDVIRTMLDGLSAYMESHHLTSLDELKTKRPLWLATEAERAGYINAMSARPSVDEIANSGERTAHGDRWGHRTE